MGTLPRRACFTLAELVVALILVGILSAMLAPFFGTVLTRSAEPAGQLPASFSLLSILEEINADYENTYHDDLAGLKTRIDAGHYGTYSVLQCEYIQFDADGNELSGGSDTDTLKVTIALASGERITALFPYQIEP